MGSVPIWSPQCDDGSSPPNAPGGANASEGLLENAIHQHQSLYELMCLNYTEVCHSYSAIPFSLRETASSDLYFTLQVHSTSKKLLYQLDHLVQLANQTRPDSSNDKQVV